MNERTRVREVEDIDVGLGRWKTVEKDSKEIYMVLLTLETNRN